MDTDRPEPKDPTTLYPKPPFDKQTQPWPGLARENLESGQDLKVTLDHRDVLAEIVARRLGNPNTSVVFPDYAPVFRGVTR